MDGPLIACWQERFDAPRDGLAPLQAQRRSTWDVDGEKVHFVGGMAELHTLSAAGLKQRALAKWPDEVGRRIAA